ncbi:UNVERIFIED_CONTAM: DNA-binding transcriptional MerR regulator [Brevibacillus sp. OAP136]
MAYKVKAVAELVGISVRTLHHYDEIGLLKPDSTTPSGYRLYTDENLETLQQILFFKEIGFNLQEIKAILDNPAFDRKHALQSHRELLLQKKQRLEEMIRTVDKTIESIEGGSKMETDKMFEGFSMEEIEKHRETYADEARRLYGKEIVDESEKRTSAYTKDDWESINDQWNDIYQQVIAGMPNGPADPRVQAAVARLRAHITANFYDCTPEVFRGLGDLYVQDERFTKNIDKHHPGLAAFLRDAMHVYCDRLAE